MKRFHLPDVLGQIACYSVKYRYAVIAFFVIAAAVSFFFITKIELKPSWIDLVPKESLHVGTFKKITAEFGSITPVICAIESDKADLLPALAEELAALLRGHTNFFSDVRASLPRSFIDKYGLLLASTNEIKQTADFIKTPLAEQFSAITQKIKEGRKKGIIARSAIDEMFVLLNITDRLVYCNSGSSRAAFQAVERMLQTAVYPISADQHMILVFIQPVCDENDLDSIGVMVPFLRQKINELKIKNPEVRYRLTGIHVINQDEMETAINDALSLSNYAFIIILFILVAAFGRILAPVIAMLILALAIAYDAGVMYAVFGRLNLFTSMSAIILLGLGVDSFIHMLTAFIAETGGSPQNRARAAASRIGPGIFYSSLTTAAAFYIISISHLDLFRELGFMLGTGMMAILISTFTLFPAVFFILPGIKPFSLLLKFSNWLEKSPPSRAAAVLYESILQFAAQKQKITVTIALTVFVLSLAAIPFMRFDYNLLNLEMKGLESVVLHHDIIKRFGFSDGALFFSSENREQEQRRYRELVKSSHISVIESVSSFAPPPEIEIEKRRFLADNVYSGADPNENPMVIYPAIKNFLETLSETAGQGGFFKAGSSEEIVFRHIARLLPPKTVKDFSRFYMSTDPDLLKDYFCNVKKILAKRYNRMAFPPELDEEILPEEIKNRYLKNGRYITTVYSRDDAWENPLSSEFISDVIKTAPEATGLIIFNRVLIEEVKKEGPRVFTFCLLAVLILVVVAFGRVDYVLLSFLPLVFAVVVMNGILVLIKVPYTTIMVMALPLILGMGIDYGIHYMQQIKSGADNLLAIRHTGKALFLTSITTLIGFFSLMLARWHGFFGMGLILFLGIGLSYLGTIIVLNALVGLLAKKKNTIRP